MQNLKCWIFVGLFESVLGLILSLLFIICAPDVLRTIQSSEDTYVFDQVISTIFDKERILMKAQDHYGGRAKLKRDDLDCLFNAQSEFQDYVIEQAKEVFTQHGAHKFESKCLRVLDDPKLYNRC